MRELDDGEEDFIRLDLETRRRLGVKLNQVYDFEIARAQPWEALLWAAKASNPAARIATWIASWSFVLGVVGIVIELAR